MRGDGLARYDAERLVQRAIRILVHGCEKRSDNSRLLRGGHAGQDYPVGAGRDHDYVRAKVATEDVRRLHIVLGAYRLPANVGIYTHVETTARSAGARRTERDGSVEGGVTTGVRG